MRTTQEILIDNQIPPTMLREEELARFAHYLSLAQSGSRAPLTRTTNEVCHKLTQVQRQLSELSERISASLDEALRQMAHVLGEKNDALVFSHDAPTLTKKHVRLVKAIHGLTSQLSEAAACAAQTRSLAELSVFAPQTATDLLLMRAALRETSPHEALLACVTALVTSPSPIEHLQDLLSRTETLLSEADQRLSDLVTTSSETITDVNRGRRSTVEYLHLLRREQLCLHDLKESAEHMKIELLQVGIPRPL